MVRIDDILEVAKELGKKNKTTHKVCTRCGELKPLKDFGKMSWSSDGLRYDCKSCHNASETDRNRTKDGLISNIYHNQRIRSSKKGFDDVAYTKEQLTEWLIAQALFHKLYDEWVASGYNKNLTPSIDRLDDYKGYSLDNIQLTTWEVNNKRGCEDRVNGVNTKTSKAILQFDKLGRFIKEHHSISDASRNTKIDRVNIQKCCSGKQKSAGGFIWEYKQSVTLEDIAESVKEVGNPKRTTSKESWKLFERTVASDFGTTRTPLSGMVKTITNSDTLHPKIYVECKYRNDDYPFWDTFEQMRSMNPERIIVLSIMPKGRKMVHLYYCEDFFKRIREDKPIVLDCTNKYKGVNTLFEQTIERAEIEDKVPVIAIKKKGGKGYLIGIAPQDFQNLKSILNKNGTSTKNGANQLRRRRGDSIGEE